MQLHVILTIDFSCILGRDADTPEGDSSRERAAVYRQDQCSYEAIHETGIH